MYLTEARGVFPGKGGRGLAAFELLPAGCWFWLECLGGVARPEDILMGVLLSCACSACCAASASSARLS